jgi:hypothetical protein
MKCGKPCEIYSRVVGYFRPIQNWNKGKREEFGQRVEFKESISLSNKLATSCCCDEISFSESN